MKYILSLIISGALVVSGFGQTRNVLVGTNNAVVQPTNFWSADASNARTGLGLGTAATNPATAFQPSSLALSNLAANNGGGLTNLNATNIEGILSVAKGGTGSTNASDARTALGLGTAATNAATAFQASSATLSNLATANGGSLTNLQATSLVGTIPSSNIATVNFSNLAGTLSIASGGTGATNAANARQNLGSTTVGDAVFIATNAAAARTAIGALASNSDGSGLTNLTAANITGTVALASNLSSPLALTNGGTGATNAATARTNLGLGWSALTNANLADVLLGYNSSNNTIVATQRITFSLLGLGGGTAAVPSLTHSSGTNTFGAFASSALGIGAYLGFSANGVRNFYISTDSVGFDVPFNFFNTTNAAISRTNLGLPWSGLTNTNAETFQAALFPSGTNPVLVDTNGEVVSPTNFWQAAPIATTLQNSQPVANATNAATNARLLFLFSLAPSTTGVTNTITLPTNGSTFNGDVATITHNAPTSSVTAIRQLGATNNIITLNQPDETVRFLYRDNQWELMDNISYIEPIYFSGTNAAANAAASRTNLGLGVSDEVTFGGINSESYIRVVSGTNIFVDLADDQNEFTAPTTFQTNVTVNGFVNFSTNHTNVAPATNNQVQRWLQIRIGTNAYFLPLYQ